MDIRNIYYVFGYINMDGTFVSNPNYRTYIVECKIGNSTGYSFYSFYTEKTIYTTTTSSISIIKLENLIDLVQNQTIVRKIIDDKKLERYKKYFEFLYLNQEKFLLEEMEGKTL